MFYFSHGPPCGRKQYGVASGWANHGDELPFSFGSHGMDCPFDADEQALADAMRQAWGNFITCGTPSCGQEIGSSGSSPSPSTQDADVPLPRLQLPAWPPYGKGQHVMDLDLSPEVRPAFREAQCTLWYTDAYPQIQYGGG